MARIHRIDTTPDQDVLFDAADVGVPLVMERNGVKYLVVRLDRMDSLLGFVRARGLLGAQAPEAAPRFLRALTG